jgi:hypothetical protein
MPGPICHLAVAREVAKNLKAGCGNKISDILSASPTHEITCSPSQESRKLLASSYRIGEQDGGLSKFLYIGSTAPDLSYFRHLTGEKQGKSPVADTLHWNRTGDFAIKLVENAKKDGEPDVGNRLKAFSIGYITHIFADIIVHPYVNTFAGAYHQQVVPDTHLNTELHMDSWLAQNYFGLKNITSTGWNKSWSDFYEDSNWYGKASDKVRGLFKEFGACYENIYGDRNIEGQEFYDYMLDAYYYFWSGVMDLGYDSWLGKSLKGIPNEPDKTLVNCFVNENYPKYITKSVDVSLKACKQAVDFWNGGDIGPLRKSIPNWNLDTGYRVGDVTMKDGKVCVRLKHSWIEYELYQ